MPEMFSVLPIGEALDAWFDALPGPVLEEMISSALALGRVLVKTLHAPSALPSFVRSTMDGYAVRSVDTFGATESLPAYLTVAGEVPMGRAPGFTVDVGGAALIHTGGMVPSGADAVLMLEQTQRLGAGAIEVLRAVAPGENTVGIGEDVKSGEMLFEAGHALRPQDLGGLMALGIRSVTVACRPRVAIISTGDEVVAPDITPEPGQIRDVNTYTVAGIIAQAGGTPLPRGIVGDNHEALLLSAHAALQEADALVVSAGSSVSTRDLTAQVISDLGAPGVLVHGVALKPGKPTILGVCAGKPVIGLPGNPVSAMVVGGLFITPLLARMQGLAKPRIRPRVKARIGRNVSSAPGREDHLPVRIAEREDGVWADPVFGKSSLIYTLVRADGEVLVPMDSNGLHQGDPVEVELF